MSWASLNNCVRGSIQGVPWELLYAEYLMISSESIEELLVKLKTWKSEVEKKGLRVNDYGDWH